MKTSGCHFDRLSQLMCVAQDKIAKNINFKRHAGTLHTSRIQWDCLFSRNGLSHSVTAADTGWGENRSSLESREPSYRVPLNLPWMYAHRCQPPGFHLNTSLLLKISEYDDMKWKNHQNDHASPLHGAPIQKLLVPPIVENTELTGVQASMLKLCRYLSQYEGSHSVC